MFFKPTQSKLELIDPSQLIVLKEKHDFNRLVRFFQEGFSENEIFVKSGRLKEAVAKAIGANSAAHLLTELPAVVDGGSLVDWLETELPSIDIPEKHEHLHDFLSLYSFGYEYAEAAFYLATDPETSNWISDSELQVSCSAMVLSANAVGWESLDGYNQSVTAFFFIDPEPEEDWPEDEISTPESEEDKQLTASLAAIVKLHFRNAIDWKENKFETLVQYQSDLMKT